LRVSLEASSLWPRVSSFQQRETRINNTFHCGRLMRYSHLSQREAKGKHDCTSDEDCSSSFVLPCVRQTLKARAISCACLQRAAYRAIPVLSPLPPQFNCSSSDPPRQTDLSGRRSQQQFSCGGCDRQHLLRPQSSLLPPG